MMRLNRRHTLASWAKLTITVVTVTVGVLVTVAGSVAQAREPWWHVNTTSAPPATSGGEGRLVVEVSDLGDAVVDARTSPVMIVDTLPAGVVPLHAYGQGGGVKIGQDIGEISGGVLPCAITGRTVLCTYKEVLLAYERFMIAITVSTESGAGTGMNEVSVSGGGASSMMSRHALALETVGSFGAENYELTPEEEGGTPDTRAGSHPFQLTTTLTFNTHAVPAKHGLTFEEVLPEVQPVGLTKDLRFDTPPGLFGNPTPLPKCELAVFTRDARECPVNTVIGVATPIVTNDDVLSNVPLAATVPLYSLEPSIGEPARFGFDTPVGQVILDASVSPTGGYHVVITVPDIVDSLPFIGSQVTFWGVPAESVHDTTRGACLGYAATAKEVEEKGELSCPVNERPQPFLVLPASCTGALVSSVSGDSWENMAVYSPPKLYSSQSPTGEPYGQDGCNKLNFEPSIQVTPDGRAGSTPTGLNVKVHVSQKGSLNPKGLAESTVRDTTVTLPAGFALDPSSADGLLACGPGSGLGEIKLELDEEQACPEASKVGIVEIKTPLLPKPLLGAAYLAAQEHNPFGSLLALYLVVYDEETGVRVKIPGEVSACREPGEIVSGVTCQVPGQLISTFNETPNLPFEDLNLHFFGGSRAPLATPAVCGSYTTNASFAPWSGNPASQVNSPPFEINTGPDGTPGSCENPSRFAPELTTGSLNLQAGAFTPFTMTMSREDGQQQLDAIRLKMPAGLSGLLSGVELCPEPQASEGLCGRGSLIGETTVSVGLGGNPYTVKGGKVYITGPYEGAPFGLSIVNPAKAGPFDLENTKRQHPACDCLVVRAKIEVDPITAALTVTSDATGEHSIPTILEGIPLQIKHVNVTISRSGFTFNPTDCEPMSVGGSLTSDQGATSSLHIPFQVTNCATLAFKPGFSVSTSGKTSRQNGASLHVKLSYPNAPFGSQANIKSVKVDLPRQLPSRLTTLQKACTEQTFTADPASCPAGSRVGTAKAVTPLIPVPLEGPAIFVSHGGAKFPELIVVLQGYGVTILLHGETFINKEGITSSTFSTIPDAPVGSFELTLPQGSDSALAANGNLCEVTSTILVKRKVKVRSKNGKTHTVTRKVKQTVAESLVMPTAFTAQNGAVIHENTAITVSECGAKAKNKAGHHKKKRKSK